MVGEVSARRGHVAPARIARIAVAKHGEQLAAKVSQFPWDGT
jgi:hypothetical protein